MTPLVPPTPSPLFPPNLSILVSLGPEQVKALVREYGLTSDNDDDGAVDFTHVDTLRAVQVRPESNSLKGGAKHSVDVSHLLHDGHTRVCRGTLSVDGYRQGEVVCKIGSGPQVVARLRKEADLYQGKLAALQGRYVPTFVGLFE